MQRICLAVLRFCLCTWVGVALFFAVSVLEVLDALLTDRPPMNRFSHPGFFLPPYFGFAFTCLGVALACAAVSLWNARIGLLRRWAIVACVAFALGMVAVDFAYVYRDLVAMFHPDVTMIKASDAVRLFQLSRSLKRGALVLSIGAALLAIWPEMPGDPPERRVDPAM
jgi:hypothetical protein